MATSPTPVLSIQRVAGGLLVVRDKTTAFVPYNDPMVQTLLHLVEATTSVGETVTTHLESLKRQFKVRGPLNGGRITELRQKANMSQEALATAMDVSRRTLRRYEQAQQVTNRTAFKILSALDQSTPTRTKKGRQ